MRASPLIEKYAEDQSIATCNLRRKCFEAPLTMSSLPAVFTPQSLQRDLQPSDISLQSRSIINAIWQQFHYIMVSLFTLVWPWITRALDERIASHYLSSFVKQCIVCSSSRALYPCHTIYRQFYCYGILILGTTLASFAQLLLDPLFGSEPASFQELIIRLCLAYFLVSEVEWWYKAHRHVEHPTIGMFRLSWCCIGLSGMIASIMSWVLTCDPGVESILFTVPWGGGSFLTYTGTALYMLVCLRPVHMLSVWLCETFWQELGDLQIGTWMVC